MKITTWRSPRHADRLVVLPFTPELLGNHAAGQAIDSPGFELLADPNVSEEAVVVGMFVVRPAYSPDASALDASALPDSLFAHDRPTGWVHNIIGHDGGGALSHGNIFDAYRLALQYGLCDAVMVSSKTVAIEGVHRPATKDGAPARDGYIWQPSSVCAWQHVRQFDPLLEGKIAANRREWQRLGYLSHRACPAQIIVTQSGLAHEGSPDFLSAAIFSAAQPGTATATSLALPLEVLVLTSREGAEQIRRRAPSFGLSLVQLSAMLIECSPPDEPARLDLLSARALLYRQHGIKIVNHDGGVLSLRQFASAGALTQLNLSLARGLAVRDLPLAAGWSEAELQGRLEYFWGDCGAGHSGAMPRALRDCVVAVHADGVREMAVCVLDMAGFKGEDFYGLPEGVGAGAA